MLRPATPLTVILFIAFVLTLLAVLSAPIIQAIPLGTDADLPGTNYGVFGYCDANKACHYDIGYTAPNDPSGTNNDEFDIGSSSARHTLSNILIVHPVACLFQLICVVLSLVAHFHSPSHSSRYLLGLIIFMLPTLLLTLLSFLVDILLFIPRVGWAGWLVLGAVVLDVLAGIMLCAMRRTLVSRKARKKRIAENAEMSGENYYNRQAADRAASTTSGARADSPPPLDQPTVPMVNGSAGADKLPQFATFEQPRVSDDRLPLNERTETATTTSSVHGRPSQDGSEYGPGSVRGGYVHRGRGRGGYGVPRDEYGNPLPASGAFGPRGPDPRGFRGRGGPGMGPRGGYAGRGALGYGPGPGRGMPGGRGGMGPGFGAGAAAGALAGPRGPPPGYTNDDYPMQDRPPMSGYGQRRQSPGPPSGPGYGRSPSVGRQPSNASQDNDPYARAESPPPLPGAEAQLPGDVARAESPPPLSQPVDHPAELAVPEAPIGMAVEMDARTGSPAQSPHVNQGGFQRIDSPLRQNFQPAPQSPSSMYSSQPSHRAQESVPYVPARAAWQTQRHQTPPAELPSNTQPANESHQRKASESYYEDVDPRFSQEQQNVPNLGSSTSQMPMHAPPDQQHLYAPQNPRIPHNNSYNSHDSVGSHFTSISERGINPNWTDPNRGPAVNMATKPDVLQSNPDFQLPTAGRGRGGAAGGQRGYGAAAY